MEKIKIINDSVVPMLIDNIDTDQIIPARFLKSIERKGFGDNLFRDWRYNDAGEMNPDFVLNDNRYKKGRILLAGNNFGCGSSREHAAWSLYDYGFRVVISTFFADIFKENALNNGLLPIQVSEEYHAILAEEVELDPETKVVVNLEKQEVRLVISGETESFEISAYKKECLLSGLDDLDYLIQMRGEIETHESQNKESELVLTQNFN